MGKTIPVAFEDIVAQHGDSIALQGDSQTYTYSELNCAANRLAHWLIARTGEGASAVGLALGHGPAAVVAMLAVLKAGKFYLPLDLHMPVDRLRAIVQDAQANCILCELENQLLAQQLGVERVLNIAEADKGYANNNPTIAVSPNTYAYLIYTSGSTGVPKGVLHNHQYITQLSCVYSESADITPQDRLALLYSPAFGGAVRDIYCALLNGARLVFFDVKHRGLPELGSWMAQQQISVAFFVATMFRHFTPLLAKASLPLPALRLIELGSEAVYASDVALYQNHYDDHCRLVVNLGGTEFSPICQQRFDKNSPLQEPLPLGEPAGDVTVLLLDESGRVVEEGESGEICVLSAYHAVAYWGLPELTSERFPPHLAEGTQRLFRSGDLGIRRADGALLHLGRKDFQIKIRGYRVESGEVEAALVAMKEVQEAVVSSAKDTQDDAYLVAYLVASEGATLPSLAQLRERLIVQLPEYMIPSVIIPLPEMPLTRSGKLDRNGLPSPEANSILRQADYIAGRNNIERMLALLWAEVLGFECVGIDDNFFDLGGQSLAAIRIVAELPSQFGVSLPIGAVFNAPSVAELAKKIAAQPALRSVVSPQDTLAGDQTEAFIAAHNVQNLCFLHELADGQLSAYNMVSCYEGTGSVRVDILQSALNRILSQHQILSSAFEQKGGVYYQKLSTYRQLTLNYCDLTALSPAEQEQGLAECQAAEQKYCFDLSGEPLLRVSAHQLEQRWYLLLNIHHTIADGWSRQLLVQDLAQAYQAGCQMGCQVGCEVGRQGQQQPLPTADFRYVDYVKRQYAQLPAKIEAQLPFWQAQLEGAPNLALATDYPRAAQLSYAGNEQRFLLAAPLVKSLCAFAKANNTSLYTVLLSAFEVLIALHSGQDDFVCGSVVSARNEPELESVAGYFATTLALRAELGVRPSFTQLVQHNRSLVLKALAHQDVPLDKILNRLGVVRDSHCHPLFQVMYVHQDIGTADYKGEFKPVALPSHSAKFDLSLHTFAVNAQGAMPAVIEYASDLFSAQSIQAYANNFMRLLTALLDAPEHNFFELDLLDNKQREQMLVQWNQTAASFPEHKTIVELFTEQVKRVPHNIAVRYQQSQLSYRAFAAQAEVLAQNLIEQGAQPGQLIGVCMIRSLEMPVALMAILKVGCAYVPIDPDWPDTRISSVLDDASLAIIIVQTAYAERFPGVSLLSVDSLAKSGSAESSNLAERLAPINRSQVDQRAYVLYTSGSTGKPKGVQIGHRSLLNLLWWIQGQFDINQDDRFLQQCPYVHDISIAELFLPLISGACLVMAKPGGHRDMEYLTRLMATAKVTIAHFVPSVLEVLLGCDAIADCHTLRHVFTGGEAIPNTLYRRYRERAAGQMQAVYGPTECTDYTTYYPLESEEKAAIMPLGRFIANVKGYVLNRAMKPVPVGVPGELYIGGIAVALGYLNRDELNTQAFVPNPFKTNPFKTNPFKTRSLDSNLDAAPKLYRSGDIVRWRHDGVLQFLGRKDDQVKLRGQRIELGEIESVIAQHKWVTQSRALLQKSQQGTMHLVAYTVAEQAPCDKALRAWCQARLPTYMVPEQFFTLPAFPLTHNGKLDLNALPKPSFNSSQNYVAPQSPLQQQLADLWSKLLSCEQIGIEDNFFDLGGHSLLMMQLIVQLNKEFAVQLSIRDLHTHPTVATLSDFILNRPTGDNEILTQQLLADAKLSNWLPDNIVAPQPPDEPEKIPGPLLLTGANGFVGIHLLQQLLQQSDAKVYCLVRAADNTQALQRLQAARAQFGLSFSLQPQRVVALAGDLAKTRLGLSKALWQELCEQVVGIYHNGAYVHHLYPYSLLRDTNVCSTAQIINMACNGKAKKLHYISALSVGRSGGEPQQIRETSLASTHIPAYGVGYVQSKWVAEQLVQAARKRGVKTTVYRLGQIMGASDSGACKTQEDNFLSLLKGCLQMGYAPDIGPRVEMMPVDLVASFIAGASMDHECVSDIFHLCNHHHLVWRDYIEWYQQAGFSLEILPYAQWAKRLMDIDQANALAPLIPFYCDATSEQSLRSNSQTHYDNSKTQAQLSRLGFTLPLPERDLRQSHMGYLINSGYLDGIKHEQ